MIDFVRKHLSKLSKKEEKFLNSEKGFIEKKLEPLVGKAESCVPEGLKDTLDKAFYNAFKLVLDRGTRIIEKSLP